MNREFKFRVWCKISKNFSNIPFVNSSGNQLLWLHTNNNISITNYLDDGDHILCQYTGLKDKRGKEIYEGDILKDENGFLYEVYWYDITASFELVERQELPDDYSTPIFHFRSMFKLEITGNIFDELNRN